jgi:hypothetical protein
MEVFSMKTKLMGLGSSFVILLAVFAFAGCSGDNALSPEANLSDNTDNTMYSPVNEEPRDQQGNQFRLFGYAADYEPEKSLIVFTAKSESDRNDQEVKYDLVVSKNAVVVLLRERIEVPFDSKYVEIGNQMIISGTILNDGTMLAERFELWQEDPNVSIGTPSL